MHADRDALALLPPIRAAVAAIDPAWPIYDVRSVDSRLAGSLGRRCAATWLVASFAALTVVLVLVGEYGVMSYDVNQRTRDIGIRLALGGDRSTANPSTTSDSPRCCS